MDQKRPFGNNQIGVPNAQLLLPFVANITTSNGKPVPNGEEVTFTARSPSNADVTAYLSNTSDTTGSVGYPGMVRTFLTLGDEVGVYTVTAQYEQEQITFEAETVTPVSVLGMNDNYKPLSGDGQIIQDPSLVLASVSDQRDGITHVLGAYLSGDTSPTAPVSILEETSEGSGLLMPITPSLIPVYLPPDFSGIEYASSDYAKNLMPGQLDIPSAPGSDFSDSEKFNSSSVMGDQLVWGDTISRGVAKSPNGPPTTTVFTMTRQFLKDGGYNTLATHVLSPASPLLAATDQADFLYISTHGYHQANAMATVDGYFTPADVANGEWKRDLDMVIISGCSVLDVTGHKKGGSNLSPGRKWAQTGPCNLLGYEGRAPGDRGVGGAIGAPYYVLENWMFWIEFAFESPAFAWLDANEDEIARNRNCWSACAINACESPKTVLHFEGTYQNPRLVLVEEDDWAGQ